MAGGDEATPFTWQDYEQRGFAELLALLGEGWELVGEGAAPEVEVRFRGQRVGDLLAIDFGEVELQLGPHECTYVTADTKEASCLSLSLEGDPYPDGAHPPDLAAAAATFRGAVGQA